MELHTKRTRVLHGAVPAAVGAGFVVRMVISDGAPISISQSLNSAAYAWSISLVVFAATAAVLSLIRPREWSVVLGSALRFVLGTWTAAAGIAFFFRREAGYAIWTRGWWEHRDYSLIGAVLALSLGFFASAWDLIHRDLASIRAQKTLAARIEELPTVPLEE